MWSILKIKFGSKALNTTSIRLNFLLPLLLLSPLAASIEVKILDINNAPVNAVAVYIESDNNPTTTSVASSENVQTISQKNKMFQPYITIIQKGSVVNFDNQDDITHHIYSAIGKNKFSFKIHAKDKAKQLPFNYEGSVPMGCNIHDWMSGHILVVDTPYYGLTNKQGTVSFSTQINNGTIKVWHPQLSKQDNAIETNFDNTNSTITIKLKHQMKEIPKQESLDDFDFLDDY